MAYQRWKIISSELAPSRYHRPELACLISDCAGATTSKMIVVITLEQRREVRVFL